MTSQKHSDAKRIASSFPIGKIKSVKTIGHRKLNDTYLIDSNNGKWVLQKLHPIFKPSLIKDIKTISSHLKKQGFICPDLLQTKSGEYGLIENMDIWRLYGFIVGETYNKINDKGMVESAASLVGQFHNLLSNLDYTFKFQIPKFHDTKFIINKLSKLDLEGIENDKKRKLAKDLSKDILNSYSQLKYPNGLPKRIVHNDLKIENIVFNKKVAVALIDFDTLGKKELYIELGDLLRSWTNKGKEWEMTKASFDINKFSAFLKGYLTNTSFITTEEIISIPFGVKLITLELAARFLTDSVEQKYFHLNESLFKNLFEQNYTLAKTQINFFHSFVKNEAEVNKLITKKT